MKSTLDQILALIAKPGYKTSEGQLTGLLISGALLTILGAIGKWLENKTSDAPGLLIGLALVIALFAAKWYSEHRSSIKGELGRLLNNPMLVEIIQELEKGLTEQAQQRIQIPGAIPIEPRARPNIRPVSFMEAATGKPSDPPPDPPKPGKIEILRNGEIEIQTFDTRKLACDEADRLRKEDPTLRVHVL